MFGIRVAHEPLAQDIPQPQPSVPAPPVGVGPGVEESGRLSAHNEMLVRNFSVYPVWDAYRAPYNQLRLRQGEGQGPPQLLWKGQCRHLQQFAMALGRPSCGNRSWGSKVNVVAETVVAGAERAAAEVEIAAALSPQC